MAFGATGGAFTDEIVERFDIVGFDPRGVGLNDELVALLDKSGIDLNALVGGGSQPEFACGDHGEQIALLASIDGDVDTPEEIALGEAAANLCIESMGPVGGLTYTLSGADMASFAIDSATGQLLTMDALDFETKASYSVTVAASDGEDESSVTVTVTVTNVGLDNAYDADDDGTIDKSEVIQAINDYLDGGDGAPSKADVIKLINLYLDG